MMPSTDVGTADFPVADALLDRDAAEAWELAAWIGQATGDNPLRSFTSVLIALLHAPNALSKWLGRYARVAGWALDDLYAAKSFRPAMLAKIAAMRDGGELAPDRERFTQSLSQIAGAAESLRSATGAEVLGVRSLKRFVNVFRLMKASLPPDELDAFHGDGGPAVAPYMSALLLLAIVNGLDERRRLAAWLESESGAAMKGADAALVVASLPRVARYSYHLHEAALA